jgi:hypothetical protein
MGGVVEWLLARWSDGQQARFEALHLGLHVAIRGQHRIEKVPAVK